MIKNKRGFELALNTIVLLIIAIMVLLFSVLFFSKGSENFLNNINNFFSYSNVDSVVQNCNLFSSFNSRYRFCCEKYEVKYHINNKKEKDSFSCAELVDKEFIDNRINNFSCEGALC